MHAYIHNPKIKELFGWMRRTNRRERCKQERMIEKQERVIIDGYEVST